MGGVVGGCEGRSAEEKILRLRIGLRLPSRSQETYAGSSPRRRYPDNDQVHEARGAAARRRRDTVLTIGGGCHLRVRCDSRIGQMLVEP